MGHFSISELIVGHGNFMGYIKHPIIWITLGHCLGVSEHWKHVSSQHCLTSIYRIYIQHTRTVENNFDLDFDC